MKSKWIWIAGIFVGIGLFFAGYYTGKDKSTPVNSSEEIRVMLRQERDSMRLSYQAVLRDSLAIWNLKEKDRLEEIASQLAPLKDLYHNLKNTPDDQIDPLYRLHLARIVAKYERGDLQPE